MVLRPTATKPFRGTEELKETPSDSKGFCTIIDRFGISNLKGQLPQGTQSTSCLFALWPVITFTKSTRASVVHGFWRSPTSKAIKTCMICVLNAKSFAISRILSTLCIPRPKCEKLLAQLKNAKLSGSLQ